MCCCMLYSCFILSSCCHFVCQCSVLPRVVQLPMLHSELLPLCMPWWLCIAACHEVASCCTVDAFCIPVFCVPTCCTVAHVVQLLPLCMPQCYVLPRAVQLLHVGRFLHVGQLMPFCMSVFCVATCHIVAHVVQLLPLVCHSVKCCRMPYSRLCCTVAAIVYASVLCCHVK